MWARERPGLAARSDGAFSSPADARLVAETLTEWNSCASCGAAFSTYIHLCPTHSRCSVNVC